MSGGRGGTAGGKGRTLLLSLAAFAAIATAFAIVNALSVSDDRTRLGLPFQAWEPWAWEFSSVAALLVLAPAVMWLSQRLRPPRMSWPAATAVHAVLTIPFSLLHVALLGAFRILAYASQDRHYASSGSFLHSFLYEYRKDIVTYAIIAALPFIVARLSGRRSTWHQPYYVEVRDGSRLTRVSPAEVSWVQAAGNYVELHGTFGALLHRQTLDRIETELAPFGFARVHRSRIVSMSAIAAIKTNSSGDFELILADGTKLAGSRRYRGNVARRS